MPAKTEQLAEAVKQAKLAYQFSPSSYTNSALSACLAAQIAAEPPEQADWVAAYLDMNEQQEA
jgi:hypothetical protein